jgi:hypothetical protein
MRLFVGITDYDWYRLHASKNFVEALNFWRPSGVCNHPTPPSLPSSENLMFHAENIFRA